MSAYIGACIVFYDDSETQKYVDHINVRQYDENWSHDTGCWSFVGHVANGAQDLNLGPDCLIKGTIQHEFLHALGFYHEHTRADRDDFVKVFPENIIDEYEINYDKLPWSLWANVGSPYDIASVMHYGSTFFRTTEAASAGLYAMTDLEDQAFDAQRDRSSSIDMHQVWFTISKTMTREVHKNDIRIFVVDISERQDVF
ncbi:unnamed protein product [Oikopleura dioica]|uniref:Metalloendopeptidase n=2 Tax=Oikopleura dioica TaxID=34765 RepID=E4XF19_OIKDI|nr:unnamed protein product [Oikopleura dioica]